MTTSRFDMSELTCLLNKLSKDELLNIHSILTECSIAASMGGSYKAELGRLRQAAKGNKKKLWQRYITPRQSNYNEWLTRWCYEGVNF